eukprot:GHVL01006676.1.p1 GENE.GHVL01006676.1~~GHVL01006676.1.p1  ORF type:complete len:207 (-),score=13.09 GHVL01006676.1:125-745(-)
MLFQLTCSDTGHPTEFSQLTLHPPPLSLSHSLQPCTVGGCGQRGQLHCSLRAKPVDCVVTFDKARQLKGSQIRQRTHWSRLRGNKSILSMKEVTHRHTMLGTVAGLTFFTDKNKEHSAVSCWHLRMYFTPDQNYPHLLMVHSSYQCHHAIAAVIFVPRAGLLCYRFCCGKILTMVCPYIGGMTCCWDQKRVSASTFCRCPFKGGQI